MDFGRRANLGYAFVNMVDVDAAQRFWTAFHGFAGWGGTSDKVCTLDWTTPNQGLADAIARYRNSPLMHPSVPPECRPAIFRHGQLADFPPPTRAIRAPRWKHTRSAEPNWRRRKSL